jgi:hypothetical protein
MPDECLKIFHDKSIYVSSGNEVEYIEGPQSEIAKHNEERVKSMLDGGWLDDIIHNSALTQNENELIDNNFRNVLYRLIESITSEAGRAIVGLTVLQLTVKSIIPDQSIRLHKASNNHASFSWRDGIPMRVLDNTYITPKLREYNLLKLNADGFMMTRSLAENYPYTSLYKANIRGAKKEWIDIVNTIEDNAEIALPALKLVITFLKSRSEQFQNKVNDALVHVDRCLKNISDKTELKNKLFSLPGISSYSARLFEILIHSFYHTVAIDYGLDLFLKPLSQMRSANKKHGNIGDIELLERPNTMLITEAWDAKFGKPYLRDELEELKDKLESHPETKIAGFITNDEPVLNKEILERKSELEEIFGIIIRIESVNTWFKNVVLECNITNESIFLKHWIKMFFEYLCLKQYEIAPIDEPTYKWIEECLTALQG